MVQNPFTSMEGRGMVPTPKAILEEIKKIRRYIDMAKVFEKPKALTDKPSTTVLAALMA